MKIVFFGTPEYCLPILDILQKAFKTKPYDNPIIAVVTQRPKPKDREKFLTYSPVDRWAFKKKIPILYFANDLLNQDLNPDLGILVAYGEIITKDVINLFPKGILNIHPSLLPKLRGASPLQAAIALGETQTGATIMKLDEKMDHGDIITQFKEEVLPTDNHKTLGDRIFQRSAEVLTEVIPPYLSGKVKPKPQDHTKATFTRMLKKEDGFIPGEILKTLLIDRKNPKTSINLEFIKDTKIKATAENVNNLIRALSPWPQTWTKVIIPSEKTPKRLKMISSSLEDGKLILEKVQLEGKTEVSWEEFKRGYPNFSFS